MQAIPRKYCPVYGIFTVIGWILVSKKTVQTTGYILLPILCSKPECIKAYVNCNSIGITIKSIVFLYRLWRSVIPGILGIQTRYRMTGGRNKASACCCSLLPESPVFCSRESQTPPRSRKRKWRQDRCMPPGASG